MDTFWRDVWSATMRNARPLTGPALGAPGTEGAGDWAPTSLRISADVLPLIRSNLSPGLQELHVVEGSFRSLSQAIPALAGLRYLSRLCLESVSIRSLEDVGQLAALPSLQQLTILSSPILEQALFRPYLTWRLPRLKALNEDAITPADRLSVAAMFQPLEDVLAESASFAAQSNAAEGSGRARSRSPGKEGRKSAPGGLHQPSHLAHLPITSSSA
ncbi:hypothetical protein WJX84_004723 [Apatococcus fuscideae]|uniref:Uncharacterized protein n=1 Tax=Apatococcus fuscideae TaxID=2026836 RepID=A0AAW1T8P3_9CHLO